MSTKKPTVMGPSQETYEEVLGQKEKRGSEVVLRAPFPPPGCYSSFWPSLWLLLPILDLAETPPGRLCAASACLCKNVTHGPSSQPGANHVIRHHMFPSQESIEQIFFYTFASRLITFIYILSFKGHRFKIIPDILRWPFMTKITKCELLHLGDGAKSIFSE